MDCGGCSCGGCGGATTPSCPSTLPGCLITCPIIPERICDGIVPHCGEGSGPKYSSTARFAAAARTNVVDTTTARYTVACWVYFAYALCIVLIDIYAFGGYLVNGAPVYTGCTDNCWGAEYTNNFYVALGWVHFVNAFQFLHAWYGRKWHEVVVWPEYLNVLGACLYLVSASYYQQATDILNTPVVDPTTPDPLNPAYYTDYENPIVMRVHYLETAAAVFEVFAAFGWFYTWWLCFPRKPGRGWTWDDPDFSASINIVVPALIYLAYNCQILLDPTQYGSNQLYIVADYSYFAGAIFYLLGALRDAGWWWWMPHLGRCNPVWPSCPDAQFGPQPWELPTGDAEREYWPDVFSGGGAGGSSGSAASNLARFRATGSPRDPHSGAGVHTANPLSGHSKDFTLAGGGSGGSGSVTPTGLGGGRPRRESSQRSNVLHVAAAAPVLTAIGGFGHYG